MADEREYSPIDGAAGAYTLYREDSGSWRWLWGGDGEDDEVGPSYPTRADALRGIADDWEAHGSPLYSGRGARFAPMMRGLATRQSAA